MKIRKPVLKRKSQPVMEGAGVRLRRALGYHDVPAFDPFLMLDDFRNDHPEDYIKGFPWHPHRGIETITYMLKGEVEHQDSMGNKGVISAGDVQWMTAGSGIIHQEMPQPGGDGVMLGFQLWANLPASRKMMKPRYQEVKSSEIPEIVTSGNCSVRVICGSFEGTAGPVKDIITDPVFLDVRVPAAGEFVLPTPADDNVFCYVIEGEGYFGEEGSGGEKAENRDLLLFSEGSHFRVHTLENAVRFLFLMGKPLKEPVAWGGPIVMNTQEELQTAFEEFDNGTFIK
ncbi:MAG TPA: pirin family protein [Bacteroidales bacterium]|jgi:redox-sensitive bicupin YhaK (pirin superfamily)|nr:pirin family protein [Bacteroidales bacterium]HPB25521.1 pirin family protein [Bacteroidales bacterium]HPI30195.1 pirin family protein [Bacteroidales bacterium]HQN16120.1 pirin family protein [Bacteroidales bacterium]HQP15613.1 pirin family protein [Bacteroidales bacterium]